MPPSELNTTRMQGLIERMRAGDAGAADRLIRAAIGQMEAEARRAMRRNPVLARWAEAEDLLQAALLRLYDSLRDERVRPESMREFHGIAAERVRLATIDLARHLRGPHGVAANTESNAGLFDASSALGLKDVAKVLADVDADLERWAALHEAVALLPEQEGRVFRLHFYNGLPTEQVAALLGIDEGSVKRTLRRARRRLASLIEDAGRTGAGPS